MGLRKSIANGIAAAVRLFGIGLILYAGKLGMTPAPKYNPLTLTTAGIFIIVGAGGVQRWLQRILFVQ